MNDKNIINDIENLRDKLYDKIANNEKNHITDLNDKELLKLSNQLDVLILKYMTEKDNKY